jgi:hypothetical protein
MVAAASPTTHALSARGTRIARIRRDPAYGVPDRIVQFANESTIARKKSAPAAWEGGERGAKWAKAEGRTIERVTPSKPRRRTRRAGATRRLVQPVHHRGAGEA